MIFNKNSLFYQNNLSKKNSLFFMNKTKFTGLKVNHLLPFVSKKALLNKFPYAFLYGFIIKLYKFTVLNSLILNKKIFTHYFLFYFNFLKNLQLLFSSCFFNYKIKLFIISFFKNLKMSNRFIKVVKSINKFYFQKNYNLNVLNFERIKNFYSISSKRKNTNQKSPYLKYAINVKYKQYFDRVEFIKDQFLKKTLFTKKYYKTILKSQGIYSPSLNYYLQNNFRLIPFKYIPSYEVKRYLKKKEKFFKKFGYKFYSKKQEIISNKDFNDKYDQYLFNCSKHVCAVEEFAKQYHSRFLQHTSNFKPLVKTSFVFKQEVNKIFFIANKIKNNFIIRNKILKHKSYSSQFVKIVDIKNFLKKKFVNNFNKIFFNFHLYPSYLLTHRHNTFRRAKILKSSNYFIINWRDYVSGYHPVLLKRTFYKRIKLQFKSYKNLKKFYKIKFFNKILKKILLFRINVFHNFIVFKKLMNKIKTIKFNVKNFKKNKKTYFNVNFKQRIKVLKTTKFKLPSQYSTRRWRLSDRIFRKYKPNFNFKLSTSFLNDYKSSLDIFDIYKSSYNSLTTYSFFDKNFFVLFVKKLLAKGFYRRLAFYDTISVNLTSLKLKKLFNKFFLKIIIILTRLSYKNDKIKLYLLIIKSVYKSLIKKKGKNKIGKKIKKGKTNIFKILTNIYKEIEIDYFCKFSYAQSNYVNNTKYLKLIRNFIPTFFKFFKKRSFFKNLTFLFLKRRRILLKLPFTRKLYSLQIPTFFKFKRSHFYKNRRSDYIQTIINTKKSKKKIKLFFDDNLNINTNIGTKKIRYFQFNLNDSDSIFPLQLNQAGKILLNEFGFLKKNELLFTFRAKTGIFRKYFPFHLSMQKDLLKKYLIFLEKKFGRNKYLKRKFKYDQLIFPFSYFLKKNNKLKLKKSIFLYHRLNNFYESVFTKYKKFPFIFFDPIFIGFKFVVQNHRFNVRFRRKNRFKFFQNKLSFFKKKELFLKKKTDSFFLKNKFLKHLQIKSLLNLELKIKFLKKITFNCLKTRNLNNFVLFKLGYLFKDDIQKSLFNNLLYKNIFFFKFIFYKKFKNFINYYLKISKIPNNLLALNIIKQKQILGDKNFILQKIKWIYNIIKKIKPYSFNKKTFIFINQGKIFLLFSDNNFSLNFLKNISLNYIKNKVIKVKKNLFGNFPIKKKLYTTKFQNFLPDKNAINLNYRQKEYNNFPGFLFFFEKFFFNKKIKLKKTDKLSYLFDTLYRQKKLFKKFLFPFLISYKHPKITKNFFFKINKIKSFYKYNIMNHLLKDSLSFRTLRFRNKLWRYFFPKNLKKKNKLLKKRRKNFFRRFFKKITIKHNINMSYVFRNKLIKSKLEPFFNFRRFRFTKLLLIKKNDGFKNKRITRVTKKIKKLNLCNKFKLGLNFFKIFYNLLNTKTWFNLIKNSKRQYFFFQRLLKLEKRLDIILVRANFVKNIIIARFLIQKGFFCINNKKITDKHYILLNDDIISINSEYRHIIQKDIIFRFRNGMVKTIPFYLELNYKTSEIIFLSDCFKLHFLTFFSRFVKFNSLSKKIFK